ncbi:hypothetical protein [Paramicrobacterium agarici]|uniref:hypothetical protein n=1 Tax=Paramicrobacterium agarici TaxID=630514 RepID=UPI0011531D68|nr:hypothetical protein [Microbacterium agarici]TQO22276.1 hypothetical protein FB385_1102 [Microbacterium agarici]
MLLTELHDRYAHLARVDPDADPLSVLYYRADIAGDQSAEPSLRITAWTRNVHALERFIQWHGRHPRENRRVRVDPLEQRLADWVRFQRRAATREGHCEYQRLRLETIHGWRWSPVNENWMANADAYRVFLGVHQRPPRYRAADLAERSLAAWAAKQRLRYRRQSRFSEDEIQILTRLKIISSL